MSQHPLLTQGIKVSYLMEIKSEPWMRLLYPMAADAEKSEGGDRAVGGQITQMSLMSLISWM